MVMSQFMGDYKEEYNKLQWFVDEVLASNPGSTCFVKTDISQPGKVLFNRFYMCLNAIKKGFKDGCRKVIGLDGCFLKGVCRGQLLSAIAKDGNGQMYPLAWAIVQVECKDTWSWFLRVLRDDLDMGSGGGFVLITDMQKVSNNYVLFTSIMQIVLVNYALVNES